MVPASRFCICLLSVLLVANICMAQEMPPDEEWKPITIGEAHGFIVPDKVLENLGLSVRHIPDDENAATYYLQAIEALGDSSYPEEELDEVFRKCISNNPPAQFPDKLREWFQTTQPARDLVDKAIKLDECAFPAMTGQSGDVMLYNMLLPFLASMRHFARLKVLEGRLHESQGEFEQAAQSYLDILKISSHGGQDSTLIGGLVAIACNKLGTDALLRLLAVHPLDADALAAVQARLTPLLAVQPARGTWIPTERAMARQIVQVAMNNPNEALEIVNQDVLSPTHNSSPRLWRILYPDRTMMRDLDDFYDQSEELAKEPPWQALKEYKENDTLYKIRGMMHAWNIVAFMMIPAVDTAESHYARMQALGDALTIDIALRRYRAEEGKFPDALTALTPKYLKSLPPDPFSGEPFHYWRENNDFILWSVGDDLDDDGGRDVGPNWHEDGDLVWRSMWEVNEQ